MKRQLLLALILCCATTAWAVRPDIPVDGKGIRIQNGYFTPDGTKDETLTANSEHRNMSDNIAWGIFTNSTTCRFRNMTSATTVGTSHRVATGQWFIRGVNPATPFINFTSCPGDLQAQ